jgi:hypothetical protein
VEFLKVMHKYLVGVGQIGGEVVLEQGSEFLMSILIFLNNYETSQVAYAKTEIKREGERERGREGERERGRER